MLDINSMSNIDLRLRLLSGDEIYADKVPIKPLKIKQIKDTGFSHYNKMLSVLTLKKEEVFSENDAFKDINLLDLIIISNNSVLIDVYLDSFCLFLNEDRQKVLIDEELGFVFGGLDLERKVDECKIINSNNFDDVIKVIKYQNCMINSYKDEKKENPADERARRILEKIKKSRETVKKIKVEENKAETNIDIADVISAVSTKSNTYNKHTVWDLTLYQLYDEYKRLEIISGYETSILAMVNGAKIENLKHWSSKLDEEEE